MTPFLAEPAGGDWRGFELMVALIPFVYFVILMGGAWIVIQIVQLTLKKLGVDTEDLPMDDSPVLAPTREDPAKDVRVAYYDEPPDEL